MSPVAIIILCIVLIAIALRKIVYAFVPIWLIMAAGAILVLVFRQITPANAIAAINPDIIFYLFGVFLICQAAESSGYLEHLTDRLFSRTHTGTQALLLIVFALGLSTALLMNDTIAIVGTPIILQLCKSHKELTKPLLLALAYAITIGSVLSPVGNPQNLLIAVKSGMSLPFYSFIKCLGIPTIINLIITYGFIYLIFRKILKKSITKTPPEKINDHRTVLLVKISLVLMLVLLSIKIVIEFIKPSWQLNFSYITLIAAIPLIFSKQRWQLLKELDWGTLIFFASTFILMESVWQSGFFQANIQHFHIAVTQIPIILILSVILSQFISNVPLVALYLPLLIHHNLPLSHLLALAAGSTIAGNLSLLGAASNVIIIQNAEKRGNTGFGFFEFMAYGLILTIINLLIYALFLLM